MGRDRSNNRFTLVRKISVTVNTLYNFSIVYQGVNFLMSAFPFDSGKHSSCYLTVAYESTIYADHRINPATGVILALPDMRVVRLPKPPIFNSLRIDKT